MMMEVDIVVMWPQVKKCGQPPELRGKEESPPDPPEGTNPANALSLVPKTLFRLASSRTAR